MTDNKNQEPALETDYCQREDIEAAIIRPGDVDHANPIGTLTFVQLDKCDEDCIAFRRAKEERRVRREIERMLADPMRWRG